MVRVLSGAFMSSVNKTLSFQRNSFQKAKEILTREENGILNAAFLLMIIVLATKFTGLLFNSLATGYLGPGPYNEFLFASNIPEIISASILVGAISSAVIPALVQAREEGGKEKFLRVLSTLINVSFLFFAVLAFIVAIAAGRILPWSLEHIIKPVDYPTVEEQARIVTMLRVLMISQIILGVSTFISSSLNVMQRFFVPQLAPLFYNFGRIFAILIFAPILHQNPWVLVWGTMIGSIAHLAVQLPLARHLGIGYRPILDIKDKYFKNVLVLGSPRIIGLSAEQVAIGVDRIIAFGLVGYSLTAYELAIRLVVIPISLFGLTFSTAAFPTLAKSYINKDMVSFNAIFLKVMNQTIFLALPFSVLLLVLRLPITRLFYGVLGNQFTWTDTRKVAWVVMFFAIGLTFESLRTLIYRTYYAVHNSMIPLISAFFVVIGGIVTGILFTNYFSHFNELSILNLQIKPAYMFSKESGIAGVGGLAFSSSLIYSIECIFLLVYLNHRYLKLKFSEFAFPIAKKLLVAFLTIILTYVLYKLYDNVLDTSKTWQIIFLTITSSTASFLFYVWLSYQFKVEEVEVIEKLIKRILRMFRIKVQ